MTSYGHETLASRLEDPGLPALAAEHGLAVADVVAPSDPFALARVIDLGGRRVELVHFGRGHTDGDVVAIVPEADVIFAGDLLEQSGPPAFGEDCHLKDWPSAVDGILGLVDEGTVIVPGHGDVCDPSVLDGIAALASARPGLRLLVAGPWEVDEALIGVAPGVARRITFLGMVDEDTVIVPGHGVTLDRMFAFDQRARISGLYGQVEYLVRSGVKQDAAYEAGEWPFEEDVVRDVLPLAYSQLAAAGLVPRTQLPLV